MFLYELAGTNYLETSFWNAEVDPGIGLPLSGYSTQLESQTSRLALKQPSINVPFSLILMP